MTEENKRQVVLETIKIQNEELNASQILEKYSEIIEFFTHSPQTTKDLELFNKFIDMLWKRKHFDRAINAIEKAGEKYPGDRGLVEKMGEIFIDAKKYEEARELFESLIELYPGRYFYHYYLGIIYMESGMNNEAEASFINALENSREDAGFQMTRFEIVEKLARLYYDIGEYDDALENLEEILTIHPRSSKWRLYFKVLEKMDLKEELEEARVTYKEIKKAKRCQNRASKYEKQNKLELALRNYKRAIEHNSYEPQYYFSVGNILEQLPEDEYEFQFEEATTYYRNAVELYPNNIFYLLALIGNLTATREWDEAFKLSVEAGEKFPELMLPSLRHLSFILGKETEYMDILRKYIEMDEGKHYSELRTELALLLKERKDQEAELWFREAAELYLKKFEYEPYQWRNYWDYANCQLELNNLESAVENLEKTWKLRGEFSVDIAEKLVEVFYRLDRFSKVRSFLVHLIKLFPRDYEYYGKLGMCFLYELDYEKAFEAFNCALTINRYIPEYLYGAAVSAARLAKTDDAINLIKDLLEMEPGFIDIIEREDAFLEVKETRKFLDVLAVHKAKRNKPAPPGKIKLKKFMMPEEKKQETQQEETGEDVKQLEKTAEFESNLNVSFQDLINEVDKNMEKFFQKLDEEEV